MTDCERNAGGSLRTRGPAIRLVVCLASLFCFAGAGVAAETAHFFILWGAATKSVGELRLLAGVEALNGLLLIGWSASYTYIAMERFWTSG